MKRPLLLAATLSAAALTMPAAVGAHLVVAGSDTSLASSGSTTITVEQASAAALGQASATLDNGGAAVEASGGVVAAEPGTQACGTTPHAAVWQLALAGSPTEALLAVDSVQGGDPDSSYASFRLALCTGAGAVLARSLELRLDGVFTNPSAAGRYIWRAVATPIGASGTPDAGAAVESRSTQLLPVRLTLRGSFDRGQRDARLTGSLSAAGAPLAGIHVTIGAGESGSSLSPAGSASTGASGRFEERRAIAGTTVFEAAVNVPARGDPAGCAEPIAAGGCADATLAPMSARSERVRVRVPAPGTLRLGSRGADVRSLRTQLVALHFLPPGGHGGLFDERTWHAVVALQGWLRLRRTGIVDRRTWRALAKAHIPTPWAPLRRAVLIDTARQVLLLVDGGRTVRAIHVSSGAYGRTPRGHFSVYRKETLSWSVPFGVWMPYASYFSGGFAMHAYSSVPSYPASHGCVRLPAVEAPAVYAFASYGIPVWIR